MTRYTDLAALRRNISPDVRIVDDHQPPAYRLTQAKPVTAVTTPTEHEEQAALFAWAAAMEGQYPELGLLFAIPNGGARHPAVAAMLKAEGVRAGVPDCLLPAPRPDRTGNGRTWHGMFLELKRSDHTNHPSPVQRDWLERLRAQGYLCIVAYGADEAISAISHYLGMEPQP